MFNIFDDPEISYLSGDEFNGVVERDGKSYRFHTNTAADSDLHKKALKSSRYYVHEIAFDARGRIVGGCVAIYKQVRQPT